MKVKTLCTHFSESVNLNLFIKINELNRCDYEGLVKDFKYDKSKNTYANCDVLDWYFSADNILQIVIK